jgi:O-antigen ligase
MLALLTFAISAGQLIKIPIFSGGISLLDITIFLLIIFLVIKNRISIKKLPLWFKMAALFAIIATLSLILTPLKLGTNEYLNSFLYTARFSLYLLFGYLVYVSSDKLKSSFQRSLVLSGIILAILGLLQFIFFPDLRFLQAFGWDPHFFRLVSTFLDPNFLGAFLVLTLISLSNQLLSFRNKNNLAVFITVFIALLLTFSRSSYLMFAVSFLVLSLIQRSLKLVLITGMLIAILFSGFFIYTKVISEPQHIDRSKSASFRLNTWQEGFDMFTRSPILGVGFNSYKFAISQYKLADEEFLNTHGATSNDSSLLFVLATTGIIGLVAYFGFLLSLVRKKHAILISALTGLLIHSFFANSLFYPPILLWLLITASMDPLDHQ